MSHRIIKIKHDCNGNPRRVIHFLAFLKPEESNSPMPVSEKYELALSRARKLGGRKFNNKTFGGGIVFQAYSDEEVLQSAQACTEQ